MCEMYIIRTTEVLLAIFSRETSSKLLLTQQSFLTGQSVTQLAREADRANIDPFFQIMCQVLEVQEVWYVAPEST